MTADHPVLLDTFTISRNWRIALVVLGALSLIALIAYPFGYDQAAFFIGGEMVVKHGAVPYRDLIDTKPPVIFYLYGVSSFLFGHNTWGIRVIEVLWQAVTVFVFYRLLRKHLSESLAFFSAALYAITYSVAGYWMTAQAETFAILPSLLILSLALKGLTIRNAAITGFLLAFIFLLKFTLVAFFGGVAIYLLFGANRKQAAIYCSVTVLSFGVMVALYIVYLNATGALSYFMEGIKWVREYAGLTPFFDKHTLAEEFRRKFPENMLRAYSITFSLVGILGIGYTFISTTMKGQSRRLLKLVSLVLFFAVLSIVYERKFFPYHYGRAYPFLIVFVAIGFALIATYFRQHRHRMKHLLWLLPIIVLYSPVFGLFSQTVSWPYRVMTGKSREAAIQKNIQDYYALDQFNTGEYLQSVMSDRDSVFFWGNGVGVYYFAKRLPTTFALTNTPFITSWTPPHWKQQLIEQLTRSNPTYIVIEWGDNREYISGTELDSYQYMVAWPELHEIVFNRYREIKRFGHFLVYQRID